MNKLTSVVRSCVDDYNMISAGDRIAVGVSGGKDSLALLCALANLRRFYPKPFELIAVTVHLGQPDMDFAPVEALCRELDVPYTLVRTGIQQVVFQDREEKNPCSLCARMRKGVLNETLLREGATKVALGHHLDDAVETFFLSLLYEGRLQCFRPVTWMDRKGVTQIRPLLYVRESEVRAAAARLALPVVESHCPADGSSRREEVKQLIAELEQRYPNLSKKIFGAVQRYPLFGWEKPHQK